MSSLKKSVGLILVMAVGGLTGHSAWSQVTGTVQTLDRVNVNSVSNVLEMQFEDPDRLADFIDIGISGTDFRACKLTALSGLFCLDGKAVKNWPNPAEPSVVRTAIDCNDPALALDTNKDDTCTALTVDLTGTIWLAGKNKKGPTFVLYRIVEQDGSCPGGYAALTPPQTGGTVYCAELVDSDKPLLVDLNPVDGDVAKAFPLGNGVLYLEERKTAVFQPSDGSTAVAIASGRNGWGLAGNEQLQSIALWQSEDGTDNRVLVTTDRGRVLAVSIAEDGVVSAPGLVFDVAASRDPGTTSCDAGGDPRYAVRTSSKSGLVYLTDRQYCEVLALEPKPTTPFELTNAQESIVGSTVDARDLTLSTDGAAGTFPPEGPTVAPGIGIDLNGCAANCTLVSGAGGAAAAQLLNVTLANPDGPSGLTLFQVKGIPDCRYVPAVCEALLEVTDLVSAGVVVPLDGSDPNNPAAQRLNMTPLLPQEITDLFLPEGLPDMYMSRFTRGQRDNGFTFEAFFGVTEDGVVFRGTFDGEFFVEELAGAELGCVTTHPPETPVESILQWDTVSTVSERYFSTNGERVDTLTNVDCGSSKTIDGRWSLKPYNTEITPCTWSDDPLLWASDGSCDDQPVVDKNGDEKIVDAAVDDAAVDDAVFAKLLLSLYTDLGDAIEQLACNDVDGGNGAAPLAPLTCTEALEIWANGLDKLEKCWNATQQPKQSAGDQNCQSFVSQLSGLRTLLGAATPFGLDPANRVGELQARIATITHVYEDRFVPSIPANGFCEPDNPDYATGCVAP